MFKVIIVALFAVQCYAAPYDSDRRVEIIPVEACTVEVREVIIPKSQFGPRRVEIVPVEVCAVEVREIIAPKRYAQEAPPSPLLTEVISSKYKRSAKSSKYEDILDTIKPESTEEKSISSSDEAEDSVSDSEDNDKSASESRLITLVKNVPRRQRSVVQDVVFGARLY